MAKSEVAERAQPSTKEPVNKKEEVAAAPIAPPKPEVEAQTPAEAVKAAPTSVTGFSLKNILNTKPEEEPTEDDSPAEDMPEPLPDDTTEEKIIEACRQLSRELAMERPRLATALEDVSVALNRIKLSVSNITLHDEIERNMLEIKRRLREIGAISIPIEFDIVVEEDNSIIKPIKVEDKLKYLTELNPELATFRKMLDLDIE